VGYQFAGFFARQSSPPPPDLPSDAVWREITSPFIGVGLLLPALIGKVIKEDRVMGLAETYGLANVPTWIFLIYDCFGGQIDFVFGLGMSNGEPFGPIEDSSLARVAGSYTTLMSHFGLSEDEALAFPPFERGFWGKT